MNRSGYLQLRYGQRRPLESLRRYGQKLTLTDAGSQSITLKLVAP